MKCLDNAPIHLIYQYQIYLDGGIPPFFGEDDGSLLQKELENSNTEILKRKLWREYQFNFSEESFQILGKLLTDERMKEVWAAINKRDKRMSFLVWGFSQKAIYMWRGIESLTPTQRKKKYKKIFDTAQILKELIFDSYEFDSYHTSENFDYKNTRKIFLKNNDISEEQFSYEQFLVYLIQSPDICALLDDIALQAQSFSKNIPLVKQPNSPNSHIHYFVRSLSNDIYEQYKQPLHNVVAIITSVIFDLDIDENYVSKTVKII